MNTAESFSRNKEAQISCIDSVECKSSFTFVSSEAHSHKSVQTELWISLITKHWQATEVVDTHFISKKKEARTCCSVNIWFHFSHKSVVRNAHFLTLTWARADKREEEEVWRKRRNKRKGILCLCHGECGVFITLRSHCSFSDPVKDKSDVDELTHTQQESSSGASPETLKLWDKNKSIWSHEDFSEMLCFLLIWQLLNVSVSGLNEHPGAVLQSVSTANKNYTSLNCCSHNNERIQTHTFNFRPDKDHRRCSHLRHIWRPMEAPRYLFNSDYVPHRFQHI